MERRKRPMEFSKKIFIVISSLFIIIIGFSMALMWRTMDTTPLAYLIPSAGGLMATCVGFYYHKAKVENALKLSRSQRQELTETINEIDSVNTAIDNFGNTFSQY